MEDVELLERFDADLRNLAKMAASQIYRTVPAVDFDDFHQDARIAALDAAHAYDRERTSMTFENFVRWRVKRRLIDRTRVYAGRSHRRHEREHSLDDVEEGDRPFEPTDGYSAEDLVAVNIDGALSRLPAKEQKLIRNRLRGIKRRDSERRCRITSNVYDDLYRKARARLRAEIL